MSYRQVKCFRVLVGGKETLIEANQCRELEGFKTSDGKLFETHAEAEAHETETASKKSANL